MKNNIFSDKISEKWKTQQIKRENDNFLLDFLHEKWLLKKNKILTAFGIQKKISFPARRMKIIVYWWHKEVNYRRKQNIFLKQWKIDQT